MSGWGGNDEVPAASQGNTLRGLEQPMAPAIPPPWEHTTAEGVRKRKGSPSAIIPSLGAKGQTGPRGILPGTNHSPSPRYVLPVTERNTTHYLLPLAYTVVTATLPCTLSDHAVLSGLGVSIT
jgi:hypothetical protein